MTEFDDIRPYNDSEVRPVIDSLLDDKEFLDVIALLKLQGLSKMVSLVTRPLIRSKLAKEVKGVDSVESFQSLIKNYLGNIIEKTIDELHVGDTSHLDPAKAYLFVSNHRDIAMDSALLNWALYHRGFSTLRIAIGDNLLTKPFASHLMRLNKSFIVNRSAKAPREKFKAAKHLSKYIHQSVSDEGENVWIAQREGRAKDGDDKTNPAVISMLSLSKPKSQGLADFIREARIVPVSISYEYDPCDMAKARELYTLEERGGYEKEEHEDVKSIANGISGYKGRVCLSFGKILDGDYENTDDVVAELDRAIEQNYILHPSNCVAYEFLEKRQPLVSVGAEQTLYTEGQWQQEKKIFRDRLACCNEKWKTTFLRCYANPVYRRLASQAR